MLEKLGGEEPDLALAYLERVQGQQFNAGLERLLAHDSALNRLSAEQKRRVFALWSDRGDLARLGAFVRERPEMASLAWRGVAKQKAADRDFAGAYELVRRHATPPTLPRLVESASAEQLQRSLIADATNYEAALALYQQQTQGGQVDDALITVRRITDQPGCPAYFHFLAAEAWAARGEHERAWNAWLVFERAAQGQAPPR